MVTIVHSVVRRWRYFAMLMIAGLLVAACASSTKASATAAAGGSTTSGGSVATVSTKTGPAGTYLTDSAGKTLYLFVNDTTSASTCTGTCLQAWPALITSGAPKAGAGVTASMLSTTTRGDGSMQVDYNNHPLYYYAGDSAAGDVNGQGSSANGGLWWLVAPSGDAIMTK
jgi:predicted lipoprotein with Yx(FWY)xxD motif